MTLDRAEALIEALERVLQAWTRRLDSELTGPMRGVFSTARDAHRAAMEEAGLTADGEDGPIPFDALRRYRSAVHGDVVRPILQFAREVDPHRRIGLLADELASGIGASAQQLPAVVTRAAPADQYRFVRGDGMVRNALKGLFRGVGVLGNLLRRSPAEQSVRLRSIAAATLEHDGADVERVVSTQLLRHHAGPLQRIAMELSAWMRDWTPVENRSHHPEAYLAEEDRERLDRLRRDLRAAAVEGTEEVATEAGAGERDDGAPAAAESPAGTARPGPGDEVDGPRPGQIAARLQEALDEVARLSAPQAVLADLRQRFDALERRLQDRMREGGTVFARTSRPTSRRVAWFDGRRERVREQWREWYDATIDRVRVIDEFLSLRIDTAEILGRLLDRTLEDSVFFLADRIEAGRVGLLGLRDRAPETRAEGGEDDGDVAAAHASHAWSVEAQARRLLEERVIEPLQKQDPRARVERAASESVEALGRRLGHVADTLSVHPIRAPDEVVDPVQPVRTLPLREIARQGLDVLHLEALRNTPAPLLDYLTQVEGECRQVVETVAFSLNSAKEVLLGGGDTPAAHDDANPEASPAPEPGEGVDRGPHEEPDLEAARTLSMEGLERAADSLEVILAPAIMAWDDFAQRADDTLDDGRRRMHSRLVVEGTVQEQLRDVRSLVRSWWRGRVERARTLRRTYGPALRRRAMRIGIAVLRLVRRGQSAMGGADTRNAERATDVLGRIPALLDPLPLIYRRLFTFQPLVEPGLMVGREDDRAWLLGQHDRWREGWCAPVVLTGSMAVGHTSFLNVMAQELMPEDGAPPVVRIVPSTRYLQETPLATDLARGLWGEEADGLLSGDEGREGGDAATASPAIDDEDRATWSFSRIEQVLRERGERRVVILERLEHFMIRIPGGCALAERLLAFQARTAPRILWVNSVSDPAWRLLSTAEPSTPGLVQVRRLEPPDRGTMEELLLTRHRHSGVPLEFVEHAELNHLARRKLKRASADKERQEILRTEFFDWLFRASEGSVLMAILLWLRSADFESRRGWLRMKPSQPIRFTFMEEADLASSFALKAFLEHESLTLDEYSRVFAVTSEESFQTLEALRGKVMIDPLDTPGSLPAPVSRLEDGVRYRIPPIITHVVAQKLRDQNILH